MDQQEMDEKIIEKIQSLDRLVSKTELAQMVAGTRSRICRRVYNRLDQKSSLMESYAEKALQLIGSLDDRDFLKLIEGTNLASQPVSVAMAIEHRFNDILTKAIQSFSGIFSLRVFCSNHGFSVDRVKRWLKENPSQAETLDTKGAEHVDGLGEREFDDLLNSGTWTRASSAVKDAIYARLDERILQAVDCAEGSVNAHSLTKAGGGPLPFQSQTVRARINASKRLRGAVDAKELENKKHVSSQIRRERTVACKTIRKAKA